MSDRRVKTHERYLAESQLVDGNGKPGLSGYDVVILRYRRPYRKHPPVRQRRGTETHLATSGRRFSRAHRIAPVCSMETLHVTTSPCRR